MKWAEGAVKVEEYMVVYTPDEYDTYVERFPTYDDAIAYLDDVHALDDHRYVVTMVVRTSDSDD